MSGAPIYVEIRMRCPFEALWAHTQEPQVHKRWDLRFTDISYLPKESEDEPQRFTYETRIGFGMCIAGTGESVGAHETETTSTSALKFASDDPRSLIQEGSGYWKYIRTEDGIRFLTLYDYEIRWGRLGAIVDRFLFRPLLGWATAWSFDRLRLWLERGIDPALSMLRSAVHALCRVTLALIWIWHGAVPKLIAKHEGELQMIREANIFVGHERTIMIVIGIAEILFGVLLLVLWRARWLYLFNIAILLGLAIAALIQMPRLAAEPFSPVSLTLGMIGLSIAGWLCCRDLPSARRCLRARPEPTS